MFVKLRRGETSQNFSVWIYGDGPLARGSGLFVGENGVAYNHHFLLQRDGVEYDFRSGSHELEIIAKLIGDSRQKTLYKLELKISDDAAARMTHSRNGLYYDWGPDSQDYHSHIDIKPEAQPTLDLSEMINAMRSSTSSSPSSERVEVIEH